MSAASGEQHWPGAPPELQAAVVIRFRKWLAFRNAPVQWWEGVWNNWSDNCTHSNANAAHLGEAEFPSLLLQMFGIPTRLHITDDSFVGLEVGVELPRMKCCFHSSQRKNGQCASVQSFRRFRHVNRRGRFQFFSSCKE